MLAPDVLTKKDMYEPCPGIFWKKCVRNDGNEVVLMMAYDGVKEQGGGEYTELVGYRVNVVAIYDMWGYKTTFKHANSPMRKDFVYEVGKTLDGPIWGYDTFEKAQRKWVGKYGASKDDRYMELATFGGRKIL